MPTGELTLPPVIVIAGSTAVGKTEAAIGVAHKVRVCGWPGAEVVSADSMQVYRGLDIGTAKPSLRERAGVPHHLIDIVDPDTPFSVAEWVGLARTVITSIRERGRVPLVSGGTPLYLEALLGKYALARGAGPDPAVRARLGRLADTWGLAYLRGQLETVDPVACARIHPNDRKRTVRALEAYLVAGRPLSQLEREAGAAPVSVPGPVHYFALERPKEDLWARIERRVTQMKEAGLVEEVRELLDLGYDPRLPAMQAVGYKEIVGHLRGEYGLDEAVRLIVRNTKRLAKRQMTWLRGDRRIRWVKVGMNMQDSVEDIVTLVGGKA
ncbi:MAG: tRNA (adenosine(37)-N6)-dimethylallyltransferase MiaA [Bacillota bacterium]|nr:MAG: tRNA (adenosine(37)-N6)-dimethylallyltransferase MiaA [Bacillota bacterium]